MIVRSRANGTAEAPDEIAGATSLQKSRTHMISAVSPGGTLHFDVFFGTCDATVFVEFLKKLMHDAPGPVFLILDNLSVHKAPPVKEYVASQDGRLKLFFLPGYSPELNPDEWVWKNVNCATRRWQVPNGGESSPVTASS